MRNSRIELLKLAVFLCLIFSFSKVMAQDNDHKKIVIAHRGASGYLPEHTLEAKTMAYAMGADYLEQDLVLSRDDVPVVIHDIYLEEVTNVKDVYPDRSRSDGRYYVIDFTWEELSRLSVNERIDRKSGKAVYPDRFPSGKSNFRLHTLMDEIELIQGLNKSTGHQAGIYPEIKKPAFHRKNGKDISSVVLGILNDYGYKNKTDPCYLQCFDAEELKRIRKDLKSNLRLTQLIELPVEINRLEAYATYADAIGPSIMLFVKGIDGLGALKYNDLAERAHALGLKVHAYTFRKDDHPYFSSLEDLFRVFFRDLNIDGGFTDHPDLLVDFLNEVRH